MLRRDAVGNVGLWWASSSAKVSVVCLSSWRSQSGCQRRFYRDVEDAVVSPWLCSGHGERVRACVACSGAGMLRLGIPQVRERGGIHGEYG